MDQLQYIYDNGLRKNKLASYKYLKIDDSSISRIKYDLDYGYHGRIETETLKTNFLSQDSPHLDKYYILTTKDSARFNSLITNLFKSIKKFGCEIDDYSNFLNNTNIKLEKLIDSNSYDGNSLGKLSLLKKEINTYSTKLNQFSTKRHESQRNFYFISEQKTIDVDSFFDEIKILKNLDSNYTSFLDKNYNSYLNRIVDSSTILSDLSGTF